MVLAVQVFLLDVGTSGSAQIGAHVKGAAALELLTHGGGVNGAGEVNGSNVARPAVVDNAALLGAHDVGKQDVGVLRGVVHQGLEYQDELALRFVNQNVVRNVCVGVLVREAVSAVLNQELDVGGQLVRTLNAIVQRSHLMTVINCICPGKDRNLGLAGVVAANPGKTDAVSGNVQTRRSTRLAQLAHQQRKQRNGQASKLAVGVALNAVVLADERRLSFCQFVRQLRDALGRNQRNGSSPLGGLLYLVVAQAHNVGLVRHVLASVCLGHGVFGEANAVGVQEVACNFTFFDQHVCDSSNQSGIGARTNRQPLIVRVAQRVVEARVNVDVLCLRVRAVLVLKAVLCLARGAHHGVGRRPAHANNQVGVFDGGRGRRSLGAPHIRSNESHLGSGVRAVISQVAARATKPTANRTTSQAVNTGTQRPVHGLGAKVLVGVLQFVIDGFNGFFPGDALELALATLAHALHGVLQAIGIVDPATYRTTTQACALTAGFFVVPSLRFGLDPLELAILHVHPQRATACAVARAVALNDGFLCGFLVGLGGKCRLGLFEHVIEQHATQGNADGASRSALDQRSARNIQSRVRFHFPSFIDLSFFREEPLRVRRFRRLRVNVFGRRCNGTLALPPQPLWYPLRVTAHHAKPLSYTVHFTSVRKKLHHIEYVIFRFPLVEHIKTR